MLKHLLMLTLAIPISVHCQSYSGSPFYKQVSAVPSSARSEGWEHSSKANGITIDLSMSVPTSSPDFDKIRGWDAHAWVDRNNTAHILHYYIQHNQLNVAFGYDLQVEPVPGTDQIKCTFAQFTDSAEIRLPRDQNIPLVPLSADLTPLVIKSGEAIEITTLPLGEGHAPVVHYLRLTRTDLTTDSPKQSGTM